MLKKIGLVLCILLFLNGCSKKMTINTYIYDDSMHAAITYPTTTYKKLDKLITTKIKEITDNFIKEYNEKVDDAELNIDYLYHTINDRYISIVIKTFISTNVLAHPINEINTFIYDIKENKILDFKDVIPKDNLEKVKDYIEEKFIDKYKECINLDLLKDNIDNITNFSLNNDGIEIYFNPYEISYGYCNIVSVTIDYDKSNIKPNLKIDDKKVITTSKKFQEIDVGKKVVALTFDDGPSKYTDKILELLKENDATATFFILGNKINHYQKTLNKMIEYGNEIGNHSYSHKWLTRLETNEMKQEIEKTQELIKNKLGFNSTLLRPTYGSVNKKLRKNTDLKIILWDVDTNDWKIKNSKTIANRALKKISDGDIVLMHDTHERTYKALKIILSELKKQGYQFVTVDELEAIKRIKSEQA